MKYTQYFLFIRQRSDRKIIKEEWILKAINTPVKTEVQSDGRIRKWAYIEEVGKYLRVVPYWRMEKQFTMHSLIEALRRGPNEDTIFSRH